MFKSVLTDFLLPGSGLYESESQVEGWALLFLLVSHLSGIFMLFKVVLLKIVLSWRTNPSTIMWSPDNLPCELRGV